ncbi:MAG TPA: ABC transporter permease, partial [Gammaproteobacteria bacterium]|nr:ABC transporter permease [Gammaproteobacteria bacterium]
MLKSHWVMAARVLRRHKLFTAINVAGLALGIACATLIGLYVAHEIGYDRFWASADRIVRISDDVLEANLHFAGTAPIVALLLENSFPEVRRSARLSTCFGRTGGGLVTVGAKSFYERNLAAADNALFEIFDFKWLAGDARTALAGPRAAVITQSAARRYFGTANALGRTFGLETMDGPFEVTGVIGDLPDNTHLKFDLLISLQGAPPRTLESWSGNCYQTYALLGRAEDAAVLRSGSAQFFEERLGKGSSRFRGFSVVAIADIHLHSKREGEMRPPGSMTSVRAFGAIALFVLAIACINYVNLATARAAQRAREVGIRRIVGAKSRQLVAQFLGESVLVTVVAVAAAAALVAATLPLFASFVDKDIRLRDLGSQGFALLGLAALVVALVAGSYPAFGLAAFRPARVLRGGVAGGGKAAAVRKALVVFQFAISIALVVVTLVVFEQTRYARNLDPGYDTDQILVLTASPAKGLGPQWEAMKRQ